jgi:hypothetical protein
VLDRVRIADGVSQSIRLRKIRPHSYLAPSGRRSVSESVVAKEAENESATGRIQIADVTNAVVFHQPSSQVAVRSAARLQQAIWSQAVDGEECSVCPFARAGTSADTIYHDADHDDGHPKRKLLGARHTTSFGRAMAAQAF